MKSLSKPIYPINRPNIYLYKDIYLQIAKDTGSYVMHEWDREKRELLFGKAVREYLNWANYQAETGKLERTLRDGTD